MTPAPAIQRTLSSPRAFNCTACGGSIEVRAAGITITAVCRHCGAVIDAADPKLRILQKAKDSHYDTALEPGDRGELYGILWEVLGHVEKSVPGTSYAWDEYLLFNPWQGFRFLSCVDGHWTFFKRLNAARMSRSPNGNRFKHFTRSQTQVNAVKGEFYWRVKVGDHSWASDSVDPPYMVSRETSDNEENLSLGVYLPQATLQTAFPQAKLPWVSGVGACQPVPPGMHPGMVVGLGFAAAAVAVVVHMAVALASPNELVVNVSGHPAVARDDYVAPKAGEASWNAMPYVAEPPSAPSRTITTESFRLPSPGNLRLDTTAGIDNQWAEFDISLINDKTGDSYDFHQTTQYYHGDDGGEGWSEGSNHSSLLTPPLPAGSYHVVIDAESDAIPRDGRLNFTLQARRGVTELSNLWLALGLIAVWPVMAFFRHRNFETRRWSKSDYADTTSDDDD